MIRVQTGSRLHFGLLSLASEAARWPDRQGREILPARRFGGVGLMIDSPGLSVSVHPAPAWSAEGPLADRALGFAQQVAASFTRERPEFSPTPARLLIESAPPEHAGLGSGTQLGLVIARALSTLWAIEEPVVELARRVERGRRSGLGVHGFAQGGFLVDAGKGPATGSVAPLAVRVDFPAGWRIVLTLPESTPGCHGAAERAAFARLADRPDLCATLCRLVLLGLVPAIREGDLDGFGEALHDFNACSGELFAPVQGGLYASPAVADLVAFLRREGVRGVGQSSWGPAVFAVVEMDRAEPLARQVRARLPGAAVWIASARNRGASTGPTAG